MGKHVFVFGAGASHASANTPLGQELIWYFPLDCAEISEFKGGKHDHTEESRLFSPFRDFLVLCQARYPRLGDLVKQWDQRAQRGEYHLFVPPSLPKGCFADELLQQLGQESESERRLLTQLMAEHILGESNSYPNKPYQMFVEKVLPRHGDPFIISLNFDFLLHEDCRTGVYFNYGLGFDWIDSDRKRIYTPERGIPLAKLHGSLDWAKCKKCGSLGLLFPHLPWLYYRAARCQRECCDGKLEPLIVVPYQEPPNELATVWASARDALSEAQRLTVIGYSFPSYDTAVRDLFRTAVPMGTEIQVVGNVVDNADVHERNSKEAGLRTTYGQVLPDRKVTIRLDGFESYVKQPDAWL